MRAIIISLGAAVEAEAGAALGDVVVDGRHAALTAAGVDLLQQRHHLRHLRPVVRVPVPAPHHDVRHRPRATPWDVRPDALRIGVRRHIGLEIRIDRVVAATANKGTH